ncbi:MAG: hypothetical protein HRT88_16710 [Lentisphaeraceae bacterium]|nr:hypothetical protein [Lentisphaeraceae bacterium]
MKSHFYFYISILWGVASLWTINALPETLHHYYWLAGTVWGVLYVLAIVKSKINTSRWALAAIMALHLSAFFSGPILEDDFYRYSWDGRNIRQHVHPYAHSPYEQVSKNAVAEEFSDLSFTELDLEDELKNFPAYTDKINYPMYRTVYPPLTEALFISEALVPDTIWGWPLFIFLVDLAFIYYLFYMSGISANLSCLILVNPLFIKEALNSWHFDFFLIPLLFLYFFSHKKYKPVSLALMTGIRPWFLALILWNYKKWSLKDFVVFAVCLLTPWFLLFILPGFPKDGFSSWKAFAGGWEFNAIFYEVLRLPLSLFTENEDYYRLISWLCGFAIIAFLWRYRPNTEGIGLAALCGWLLFLPTVNPWYIMPLSTVLIAIKNRHLRALGGALSTSMPMAYLHYAHLDAGNYLDWSWALAQIAVASISYFFIYRATAESL